MITTKLSNTFLASLICILFSSMASAQNGSCPISFSQSINSDGTMNELSMTCTIDWAWHLENMEEGYFKITACSGIMTFNEEINCVTFKIPIGSTTSNNLDCTDLFDDINTFYINQQEFTEVLEASNNDELGARWAEGNRIVSEGFAVIDDISIISDLVVGDPIAKIRSSEVDSIIQLLNEYDYYFLHTDCNTSRSDTYRDKSKEIVDRTIYKNGSIELENTLNIPNPLPNRNICPIVYNVLAEGEIIIINVFNVNGELIDRLLQPTTHYSGVYVIDWSIEHLAKGSYFVQLQSPYRLITKQVVKVR